MSNAMLKERQANIWDAETFKIQSAMVEWAIKGVEWLIWGGSEPLEYCGAPQKWSTCCGAMQVYDELLC